MFKSLIGNPAIVVGNDFILQDLKASIVMYDDIKNLILLKLDRDLVKDSKIYQYIVVSPRDTKKRISPLIRDKVVGCSMTWVPTDKYNLNKPMDLSWWRGGAAAITDLCIK